MTNPLRCLSAMFLAAALCAPVSAAVVSFSFGGTLNLQAYGASATSSVAGTVSWDSATPATSSGGNFAAYALMGATLSINGVNHSAAISPTSFVDVTDNASGTDALQAILLFSPLLDLGPSAVDGYILNLGFFDNTNTMFNGFTLPNSTAFIAASNSRYLLLRDSNYDNAAITNDVSTGLITTGSVPEPGTLALGALAMLAAAGTRRRRR